MGRALLAELCAGLCAGACCFLMLRSSSGTGQVRLSPLRTDDVEGFHAGSFSGSVSKQEGLARPSLGLVLQMIAVAVQSGTSIPHALEAVGLIVSGQLGRGMQYAAGALLQGYGWQDAWIGALEDCQSGESDFRARGNSDTGQSHDEQNLAVLRDVLEDSWMKGSSPVGRLESTIEQLDVKQRQKIEQSASRLSVRVLIPTGLCFLPAFMLIGVIPAVASFIA